MTSSRVKHIQDRRPPFLRRALHLQHHRHTGKLLHHKHTSYRGLAILLLIVAPFMTYLYVGAKAGADPLNLYVTARNPAPIPTTPAVITQPTTGYTTHAPTLTVSGSCPVITPQVSIAIVDNGTIIGSAPCASDNTFTVIITLNPGQNTLIARSFTITDDSGPDSTPVLVTYVPLTPPKPHSTTPKPASGAGSTGSRASVAITPLLVTIKEPFIVFGPNKAAVLVGTISGGIAPYTIHIDWGDSSEITYTKDTAGNIHFTHLYMRMQSYTITMNITDQSGQSVIRQYAAITPYQQPVVGSTITPPTYCGLFCGISPFAIYGAYLLLLSVVGGLWVYAAHSFEYARIPVHSHNVAGGRNNTRTRTRR